MPTIIHIIKKIFGIDSKSVHDYTIIRLSDTLKIPDINAFINDKESYKIIEDFLNEYNKALKKDIALTFELDNKPIYNKINMLTSLTAKIFVHEKEHLFDEKSKMKKLILLKKFELYLSDIQKCLAGLMYRLVALTEIKTKVKLPKRKREVIEQEIENLTINMLTCMNQKDGILSEANSYRTILQSIKIEDINKGELKSYYQELRQNASKVVQINDIDIMEADICTKIATLEKSVEAYFYQHPEYRENLSTRLQAIDLKINEGLLQGLLNEINQLEKDSIFYDKYGKALGEDIKTKLYKLKFEIVTNNFNLINSPLLETEDPYAKKIYFEEVEQRIDGIIRGNNPFLLETLELYGKDIYKEAVKLLKEIFTEDSECFNTEKIINNIYYLQLLVSLDSKEQFINWFKRDVNRDVFLGDEYYSKYFHDTIGIVFNKYIPIETICYVLLNSEESTHTLPLVKLYSLLEEMFFSHFIVDNYRREVYYYIPEGIKKFQIYDKSNPNYSNLANLYSENVFLQKLRNNMDVDLIELLNNTNMNEQSNYMYEQYEVFPQSLKSAVIAGIKDYFIKFQNGVESLKIIDGGNLLIIIPPSVKNLEIKADPSEIIDSYIDCPIESIDSSFIKRKIEELTSKLYDNIFLDFENYKDSNFLRKNINFIKSLPKTKNIWINFIEGGETKKTIIFYREIAYYESFSHSEKKEGGEYQEITYLRKKQLHNSNREEAEKEFQDIINSIDNRDNPRS